VDVFVDLEVVVVVVGSDLERVVVVVEEGGTYELSAAEAIHQRFPSEYGIRYVQETTTGAGAASELDSTAEELELASDEAAEEAAAEEEEEDKQESSPPPTFIFWT
jgi:hypothetical protein